jgi:C1A family cysteine protease
MVLPTFAAWAAAYGKVYNGDEALLRETVYNANIEKIQTHNEQALSWSMDVNQFADLSPEEFVAQYTGLSSAPTLDETTFMGEHDDMQAPPSDIDWVTLGALNPVQDQGECGSCWAFSAVGALESALYVATGGALVKLSEQQLIDCSIVSGCDGSFPSDAYQYYAKGINGHHGMTGPQKLCSEASYEYTGVEHAEQCLFTDSQEPVCDAAFPAGTVTGFKKVKKTNKALKSAIASQPISVSVFADLSQWQFYAGGVFTGDCPSQTPTNHAVVAVGYGSDYFKIRNSWGSDWGESGYIRLLQDSGEKTKTACLMKDQGVYPTIATPCPPPTPVPPPPPPPSPPSPPSPPTPTPPPPPCSFIGDVKDFVGGDVRSSTCTGDTDEEKDADCCAQCDAEPQCEYWVRATDTNDCWLKRDFLEFGENPLRRGNFKGGYFAQLV